MSKYVLDLGGSIVASEQFDIAYLKKLKKFFQTKVNKNKFYVVVGGGFTCRKYLNAVKKTIKAKNHDLDKLGIEATRLNANFLKTVLGNLADPEIFYSPKNLKTKGQKVLVGGGWKPGNSTDFVAVKLAQTVKADCVIVMTNVDYVYDKDPNKFKSAKKITNISWVDFRKLIGDKWVPGAKLPLDPKACSLAEKLKLKVIFLNGKDLKNLENYLQGKKFRGTVISK